MRLRRQAGSKIINGLVALADSGELERQLGVSFGDRSLLEQALLHSSYVNENPELKYSNERLEFLGDAVLGLVVAERLFLDSPDFSEGGLTRARAALVREETLACLAGGLDLGEYLYLGKGEEKSGGRYNPRNLARALEAIIGALFLDQGMGVARQFILRIISEEVSGLQLPAAVDFKTNLQELVQSRQQAAPVYELVSEAGLPHDRIFTIAVRVGDQVLGTGSGKSKKIAETEAAAAALARLERDFS
jgi:ribonuclease-3